MLGAEQIITLNVSFKFRANPSTNAHMDAAQCTRAHIVHKQAHIQIKYVVHVTNLLASDS
jgi:hypothetical protein